MGFIIGTLKIIGLILLFIVLFLLLIVCILLFFPFRYQLMGQGEPYACSGKVQWLFGLIKVGFTYEDGQLKTQFRYPFKKKDKKKEHSSKTNEKVHEDSLPMLDEEPIVSSLGTDEFQPKEEIPIQGKNKKKAQKIKRHKKHKKQGHNVGKKTNLFRKIKQFLDLISEPENKELIRFLVRQFKYLIKKIKPGCIKGNLIFSTTDPALTGELLGILSFAPYLYQKNFSVAPDFSSERFYLQGDINVKGKIFGIHFLVLSIRLLMNKKIRTILFNRG